jgi:hypothetical protein
MSDPYVGGLGLEMDVMTKDSVTISSQMSE